MEGKWKAEVTIQLQVSTAHTAPTSLNVRMNIINYILG